MARMHARRRGISRSVRPYRTTAPEWSNTDKDTIIKQIVDMKKQGVKLATGKRVDEILRENGLESTIPEDLRNLIEKALGMRKHLSENKKDLHNKRQLNLTEAKVRRLVKYYVKSKRLPAGWVYKPDTAEILLSR